MNERIPLKIRLMATGIHAVNTIVNMFSGLIVLSNIFLLVQIPTLYPGAGSGEPAKTASVVSKLEIWQIPLPLLFALVAIFIMWRTTKTIHPFVSRAGRYATNHTLNCLIMPFFVFALFCSIWYTVCGIKPLGAFDIFIFGPVSAVYGLMSIAYFLNSIIAGIFTLRGYDFNTGLIIPFVRSE
jgi:uncharacterized Tic20 family protein